MDNADLAGRCGIYCGACTIYRAYKGGGELLRQTAEKLQVPAEEIVCEGCGGPVEKMWRNCRRCDLIACMSSKQVGYCYECTSFDLDDCEKYRWLVELTSKRGEDIRSAENAFKKGQMEDWLKQQQEIWRCRGCHRPISWYEEICLHCGVPSRENDQERE